MRSNSYGLKTIKALGQHFLVDQMVIQKIVDTAISEAKGKSILEIGPGPGVLTKPLLNEGLTLTCIEKDKRAVELLEKLNHPLLKVMEADVLDFRPNHAGDPILCLGNLPYYITSPILLWAEKYRSFFHTFLFMVQNEVADRVVAPHGTKEYGRLTARLALTFHIEKLFTVGPNAFAPPPKVDSAVIKLTPKKFVFESEKQEKRYEQFSNRLFSARRKMLRRILGNDLQILSETDLNLLNITPDLRPDALNPDQIWRLFIKLSG